jgi:hypothetical protein
LSFHLPIYYDALYPEVEKQKHLSLKDILLLFERRAATGIGIQSAAARSCGFGKMNSLAAESL